MYNKNSKGKQGKYPNKGSKNYRKGGNKPKYDKEQRGTNRRESDKLDVPADVVNNPNWYFTDAMLADQVSQLSFQNLAGYPLDFAGVKFDIPNIVRIELNPCPGVINATDYSSVLLNKTSGVNMAGFKIFSKLSAYTGRVATYAPHDISIMILAMGEVISAVEWCRRTFGVANASSMRNRSYPREMLTRGLLVDDDDFFKNYSNYRTRFNGLITMINQLPIPKGIAYFDKCASLYEKVYLDSPSSMAQTLVPNPYSTWLLDEQSDPNGSMLATTEWHMNINTHNTFVSAQPMSYYLDILDRMIGTLLNSSTLQVVYTDLLNLSTKVGQEFWKFDYLPDGYLVVPEYSEEFMLQMHNSTIAGPPMLSSTTTTAPIITAYNDVVSNPNTNTVYYNPVFFTCAGVSNGVPRTGTEVLVDMLNDHPSVVERVEFSRYSSISGKSYTTINNSNDALYDAVLPDHYIVYASFQVQSATRQPYVDHVGGTVLGNNIYQPTITCVSHIDWAPRFYEYDINAQQYTGEYLGDLNFYTVASREYLAKLHQFMTLALYDLR